MPGPVIQIQWTPLMHAAADSNGSIVKLLLEAGADKEAKSVVRRACVRLHFQFEA